MGNHRRRTGKRPFTRGRRGQAHERIVDYDLEVGERFRWWRSMALQTIGQQAMRHSIGDALANPHALAVTRVTGRVVGPLNIMGNDGWRSVKSSSRGPRRKGTQLILVVGHDLSRMGIVTSNATLIFRARVNRRQTRLPFAGRTGFHSPHLGIAGSGHYRRRAGNVRGVSGQNIKRLGRRSVIFLTRYAVVDANEEAYDGNADDSSQQHGGRPPIQVRMC
jgi:hypothetical protein